ncbi:universal stress protein [Arthrobacter sp. AK04]|uniref:universal stress protein n=1 Tax=Arthrobacter sp. AK04 TaxID=2900048 RepID=UPI002570CF9E|nr:universal stress protein [Arthrobacter sp. AK04]
MNAETVSKPVIVGVDGSEYSSAALRYAGALAARLGARLEVITCIGMPDYLVVAHLEGGEHPLTARLEETAARLRKPWDGHSPVSGRRTSTSRSGSVRPEKSSWTRAGGRSCW